MGYKEENETSVVGSTPVFSTPPAKTTPTPPASNAPVMSAAPSESAPKPTPVSSVPLSSPTQSAPQVTTAPSQVPLASSTSPVAKPFTSADKTPNFTSGRPNFSSRRPDFSNNATVSAEQKRIAEEMQYAEELRSASDIVLQKDKKPANKKLIALFASAAAALIIGAVVLITVVLPNVSSGGGGSSKGANASLLSQPFSELYESSKKLLDKNYVAETTDGKEDEDFEAGLTEKNFKDFQEKYNNFKKEYSKKSYNSISDEVSDLDTFMEILDRYINVDAASEEVFSVFSSKGTEEAVQFVEGFFKDSKNSSVYSLSSKEKNYYYAALEQYAAYSDLGCANGGGIDFNCAKEKMTDKSLYDEVDLYAMRAENRLFSTQSENELTSGLKELLDSLKEKIGDKK